MLTLEISHICPHIRVQGVDDHFAICGPSDLYSAVDKTRSWRSSPPCVVLTDVLGLREEVKKVALVELGLADYSPLQELLSASVECAVKESKEDSSIFAENVTVGIVQFAEDVNLAKDRVSAGCHCVSYHWMVCIYAMTFVFKIPKGRNAMMYACGEGWAAGLYISCHKRHPSRSWAEDLLSKV